MFFIPPFKNVVQLEKSTEPLHSTEGIQKFNPPVKFYSINNTKQKEGDMTHLSCATLLKLPSPPASMLSVFEIQQPLQALLSHATYTYPLTKSDYSSDGSAIKIIL
jgi:hypothetical protein